MPRGFAYPASLNGFFGLGGVGFGGGGSSGGGVGSMHAGIPSPFLSLADAAAMTPGVAGALLSAYMGVPGMASLIGDAGGANLRADERNGKQK